MAGHPPIGFYLMTTFGFVIFAALLTTVLGACGAGEHTCYRGTFLEALVECIPEDEVTDGKNDCGMNSDEVPEDDRCRDKLDSSLVPPAFVRQFTCSVTYQCLYERQVLDEFADCPDKSDEHKWLGSFCRDETDPSTRCCLTDDLANCIATCYCHDFVPHSECTDDACVCADGYAPDGLFACNIRSLGDDCTGRDADCSAAVANSVCADDMTCGCGNGHYVGEDGNSCIGRVYNDTCTENIDCDTVIENSICDVYCICRDGYLINQARNNCLRIFIGLTVCSGNDDCLSVPNASCGDDGVCECDTQYQSSNDQLTCERITLGSQCTDTSICLSSVANSVCSVYGVCLCAEGYELGASNLECILRSLNSSCGVLQDCSAAVANSICGFTHVCECGPAFTTAPGSNVCVPRTIGDQEIDGVPVSACTADVQCATAVPHSLCINNVCACEIGYVVDVSTMASCIANSVNSTCSSNEECSTVILYGQCNNVNGNMICGCESGYSADADGVCQRTRIGVGTCTTNADCTRFMANSNCTRGACFCNSGYAPTNFLTSCTQNRITSSCVVNTDCHMVNNSHCPDGRCRCLNGYYDENFGNICTQTTIGGSCIEDSECILIAHSVCSPPTVRTSYTCQCAEGYIQDTPTSCRPPVLLVDLCETNAQCGGVSSAICFNGTCTCPAIYVVDEDTNSCDRVRVGDGPCPSDEYCQLAIVDGLCVNNVCVCPDGYGSLNSGTRCQERTLNSPCDNSAGCSIMMDNTICSNGVCACSSGYYPAGVSQCDQFHLGDHGCSPGDCHLIMNGECINNVCNCSYGYSPVGDNCACDNYKDGYCIIIEVGVTKFSPDQSFRCAQFVDNSYWSNVTHTCLCHAGYSISGNLGSCVARRFNSSCSSADDCVLLNNSTCSTEDSTCSCVAGMFYDVTNSSCIFNTPTSAPSTEDPSCSFTCENPWFVPVVVSVGAVAIIGGVVAAIFKLSASKAKVATTTTVASDVSGAYERPPGETPRPPTRSDTNTTMRKDSLIDAEGLVAPEPEFFRGKTILAAVTE